MINKLLIILKCSGVFAITMFMVKTSFADTTEYVFSAPPEVDNNVVEEIPAQETDYPLYECDRDLETENANDEDSNGKIDSHDCDCLDCGEVPQDLEKNKLSSRKEKK